MIVKVSSKGQIVLPAEIRKRWDINPGDELAVVDVGWHVSLVPLPEGDAIDVARGLLAGVPGVTMDAFMADRRRERDRENGEPQP